jgi:hypothetical protein
MEILTCGAMRIQFSVTASPTLQPLILSLPMFLNLPCPTLSRVIVAIPTGGGGGRCLKLVPVVCICTATLYHHFVSIDPASTLRDEKKRKNVNMFLRAAVSGAPV